jgi:hypothetical protein
MASRFLSAEADLIISYLALSDAFRDVFVSNLAAIAIRPPSMRKYCIWRNLIRKCKSMTVPQRSVQSAT